MKILLSSLVVLLLCSQSLFAAPKFALSTTPTKEDVVYNYATGICYYMHRGEEKVGIYAHKVIGSGWNFRINFGFFHPIEEQEKTHTEFSVTYHSGIQFHKIHVLPEIGIFVGGIRWELHGVQIGILKMAL